jgi:cell wall-associated NlpC family hydrolase
MRNLVLALFLAVAGGIGLGLGGIGSASAEGVRSAPALSPAVSGESIVETAVSYVGTRYNAHGKTPATGFNAIGFVSFVYRMHGIHLPFKLPGALEFAAELPAGDLRPGDVLYFKDTIHAGLSHAGIFIGGGRFVHAEWFGYGVTITSLSGDERDGNYWGEHLLTANRPWNGRKPA